MRSIARSLPSQQALIDIGFFCGVPVVLAVLTAAVGPYAGRIGFFGAFAYVLSLSLIPWWLAGLTTQLASRVSGGRLPLWLTAAFGAIAAGPLVSIYALSVNWLAGGIWPDVAAILHPMFSVDHLKSIALSEGRAIMLWIAFVVIFHETLGWQRFAPAAKADDRDHRFQLSGADWTAEDDAALRAFIGDGLAPRAIAAEMKRTVGAVRARTAKLGLRNNRAR
ncbi:hypothetical protein [Bradyrhizobium sp. USDA 10063]